MVSPSLLGKSPDDTISIIFINHHHCLCYTMICVKDKIVPMYAFLNFGQLPSTYMLNVHLHEIYAQTSLMLELLVQLERKKNNY